MKKFGLLSAGKLLWSIANKKERAMFIALLFSCLIRVSSELLTPLVTACVIAKLSGKKASILFITFSDSISNIGIILIAFGLVFIVAMLGSVVRSLVRLYATKMMNKVNEQALSYVLENRKNFNLNMTNGEASYIIKNASEQVFYLIQELLIKFITPVISAIIALIYIVSINYYAFFIILGALICIVLSIWYRIFFDKKIFKALEQINGKISNHNLNNIENLPFIGFFKTKAYELELLKELNKDYFKYEKKKAKTYLIYWLLIYIFEFACTISVIILILGIKNIDIVATLIIIVPYLMQIFSSAENLAFVIGNCQQYSIKISRLLLLKAKPNEIININGKLPENVNIHKITIKNMQVEIGDFSKQINNVNFYKGQINCLAGGSGSGKTTLLNCLLGLKEYKTAEIYINDNIKLQSLFFDNDRVSISFQGEIFFDRSLTENVMYPCTELNDKTKELINYFDLVEVFNREININDNLKNTLSGGEKKRISFIRGLTKDAEIYIFDEPTNELDETNVQKVITKIEELNDKAIVIVISHDKRLLSVSENIIYL